MDVNRKVPSFKNIYTNKKNSNKTSNTYELAGLRVNMKDLKLYRIKRKLIF